MPGLLAVCATLGSSFGRSEGREAGLKTKKKSTIDLLAAFLLVLQVTVVLTAGEERKKGGSQYGSPLLPGFHGGA